MSHTSNYWRSDCPGRPGRRRGRALAGAPGALGRVAHVQRRVEVQARVALPTNRLRLRAHAVVEQLAVVGVRQQAVEHGRVGARHGGHGVVDAARRDLVAGRGGGVHRPRGRLAGGALGQVARARAGAEVQAGGALPADGRGPGAHALVEQPAVIRVRLQTVFATHIVAGHIRCSAGLA